MRFVAGRGAVAERCREAALWRSICWLGIVAESHREAFAGRGTVAERLQRGGAMAEHLLARGTVAENHREAFAGQGAAAEHHWEAATAGNESHCRKGEILLERRDTAGNESHCR